MTKFADKFTVESSRLAGWNYASPGFYFVTICTLNHNNFFGKIIDGKMTCNRKGFLAYRGLINVSINFKNIKLIDSVVMPNHIHILLEILDNGRDAINRVSTINIGDISAKKTRGLIKKNPMICFSLGTIVRWYKAKTAREIREEGLFFGWQPRFYDEVIRNKNDFFVKLSYIKNNPKNWHKDQSYCP